MYNCGTSLVTKLEFVGMFLSSDFLREYWRTYFFIMYRVFMDIQITTLILFSFVFTHK